MKKQKGFTLIELLVVIAIIGILTGVGIASFTRAQRKARDARRIADLEAVGDALQLYYSDYNIYPTGGGSGWRTMAQLDGSLNATNTYMKQLPTDPLSTNPVYGYQQDTDQCYCLRANLEVTTGSDTCSVAIGATYNYGVACP